MIGTETTAFEHGAERPRERDQGGGGEHGDGTGLPAVAFDPSPRDRYALPPLIGAALVVLAGPVALAAGWAVGGALATLGTALIAGALALAAARIVLAWRRINAVQRLIHGEEGFEP